MALKAVVFDAYGTLFDVQSVAAVTDAAFPGHGDYITQVWRLKQLEYTWLRSLMGQYADFWTVTREALAYTLATLGLVADEALFDRIAAAYDALEAYPDAEPALAALGAFRLAIFSNGSPAMLAALVGRSPLGRFLEASLSVDAKRVYKPDPRAYALVEEALGVAPAEALFVSSNGFDVSGAKQVGFAVARIERVPAPDLSRALVAAPAIGPSLMFKALRTQAERCGAAADWTIASLTDLPALAAQLAGR
jgi:2-haloacid dehalogenase